MVQPKEEQEALIQTIKNIRQEEDQEEEYRRITKLIQQEEELSWEVFCANCEDIGCDYCDYE